MRHIFLTFRYKHTARRLASNINLYMACYKTPHFLFQRTLFLFHVHFPCYIFLFHLPRRKGEYKFGKVDRLPLPFHHNLYHDNPPQRPFVSMINILFFFESLYNCFLFQSRVTYTSTLPLSHKDFLHRPLFLLNFFLSFCLASSSHFCCPSILHLFGSCA